MVLYNLQNVSNSTNVITYIIEVNNVSGGFLLNSLLGALWIIMFVSFKTFETEDAMVGATFFVLVIAAFLRFSPNPVISDATFYFWFAGMFLTVIISIVSRNA